MLHCHTDMSGLPVSRRGFLNTIAGAAGGAVGLAGVAALGRDEAVKRQPNVMLVMTDDQGYGDLGCHGIWGHNTHFLAMGSRRCRQGRK